MERPVSSSAILASTSRGCPEMNIWRNTPATLCSGGMATPPVHESERAAGVDGQGMSIQPARTTIMADSERAIFATAPGRESPDPPKPLSLPARFRRASESRPGWPMAPLPAQNVPARRLKRHTPPRTTPGCITNEKSCTRHRCKLDRLYWLLFMTHCTDKFCHSITRRPIVTHSFRMSTTATAWGLNSIVRSFA